MVACQLACAPSTAVPVLADNDDWRAFGKRGQPLFFKCWCGHMVGIVNVPEVAQEVCLDLTDVDQAKIAACDDVPRTGFVEAFLGLGRLPNPRGGQLLGHRHNLTRLARLSTTFNTDYCPAVSRGRALLEQLDLQRVERTSRDAPDGADRVRRVAEINRMVRGLLEDRFPSVWVEGELSDVTRHASGHVYFTLNDTSDVAQLRGVMFRSDARRAKAKLERGALVRMRGALSLYPERGSYQLIARSAVPAGDGDLLLKLQQLKAKLEKEGLFASERKRSLPSYPSRVGVVTSTKGAALQDIIRVAKGRFPIHLVVSDCRVQGVEAPSSIVAALARLEARRDLDAIIVARGGGAAEDLGAFNDERVVRAVAGTSVPIVTGVGHESDQTLVELAADCRAATPSNAVEVLLPERSALESQLSGYRRRLERTAVAMLDRRRLRLATTSQRLRDPQAAARAARARLAQIRRRLEQAVRGLWMLQRKQWLSLSGRLRPLDARSQIRRDRETLYALQKQLGDGVPRRLLNARTALVGLATRLRAQQDAMVRERRAAISRLDARLQALDPNAVLRRGYALALRGDRVVGQARDALKSSALVLRFQDGEIDVTVNEDQAVRSRTGRGKDT